MKKENKTSVGFSEDTQKKLNIAFWCFSAFPFVLVAALLLFQSEDEMPSVAMLDNPPELLASVVLASDGETELGRYWRVNRTSAEYKEISPYVTDALISTEDERFMKHSGVDFK
ncbi:MAG: transglycosylase domain-containing protein, partial [Flammeovirgaceae bacterium]